jgi:hypothetical protein
MFAGDRSSDDYKELSSPVFVGSSVVVGRRDGLVLAYDVLTGAAILNLRIDKHLRDRKGKQRIMD